MTRKRLIKNVMLKRQPSKAFATVEQLGRYRDVSMCSEAGEPDSRTPISVDGGLDRRCTPVHAQIDRRWR